MRPISRRGELYLWLTPLMVLACGGASGTGSGSASASGTGATSAAESRTSGESADGTDTGGTDPTDGSQDPPPRVDPCAEPTHAPIGADWPEVFVGIENCNDDGPGSAEEPLCSLGNALDVADTVPYVVTVLDGTYRLMTQPDEYRGTAGGAQGTADAYFVLRAAEGARPVFLGSLALEGSNFEDVGGGVYRIDAEGLRRDPTGLWTSDGLRIEHETDFSEGRTHSDRSALMTPGTWTKADAQGLACGGDNVGCYVYMIPPAGIDLATTRFEAAQRPLANFGPAHYAVLSGLTVLFTQPQGFFFERANHLLIEDNEISYTANSNDNSYSMRIWNTNGTIVRNNRVRDSRYWGGVVNSHGITFMISGYEEDNWVCHNEVFEIDGTAISTKSGVSNHHLVGNYVHDCFYGTTVPGPRNSGDNLRQSGAWIIHENVFENCAFAVTLRRGLEQVADIMPSTIYNNTFIDSETALVHSFDHPQPSVRNNIFTGEGVAFAPYSANQDEYTIPWFLAEGFDSDYNLVNGSVYMYSKVTDESLSLAQYREAYQVEDNTLAGDPLLGDSPEHTPQPGSPALAAGDASLYPEHETISMGHRPFAHQN